MDTLFGKVMKIVSLAKDWKTKRAKGRILRTIRERFTQSLIRLSLDALMVAVKFASKLAGRLVWVIDLGLSGCQIYASVIIGTSHAAFSC